MSAATDAAQAVRATLWTHGYRPLPVQNAKRGDKTSGKAPLGKQWGVGARKDPPECLQWPPVAHALNTGILCDGLRVIDLDIDDPGLAGQLRVLALTMFGATIVRTRENSPRCLLVYRAAEGEPTKVAITGAAHSDSHSCKVEVLGKGQQFVAYGGHWSGSELQWPDGGPADRLLAFLPAVSEAKIHAFLNAAGALIDAQPIELAKPKKPPARKGNGKDRGTPEGETFFAKVNTAALQNIGAWVEAVFTKAVEQAGTGAWRVSSATLDRNLEEDLSIHPDGIRDFGLEVKLSPIDVVITHGNKPNATTAALWLCDQLGHNPADLGFTPPTTVRARRPNGEHHEVLPEPGSRPLPEPDVPIVPAPETPPGEPRPGEPEELPAIYCIAGELPRMVRQAQQALIKAKAPIYQRGMLVQPVEQEYRAADGSVTHSAALVPLTAPALLKLMAQAAIYQKWDGRVNGGRGGFVTCDPPPKLVDIVLHNRGDWPFPVVRGVLTAPTMRPDGSLLLQSGYDPVSRYYLMFPAGLELPEIPDEPTPGHAQDSLNRLDELLDSYPFVSGASRSVALAMLMTQVLRAAMPTSPLLAVSARAPGTGKSHLVDLCSTVAIGRPCPAMGTGKRDEETEKGINTMLISGVPGFSIDNVSRDLDTPILNMATERPLITIRLFGVLEAVEIENAVVIYMTGNNLAIIDEQGRRTIRCELDAGRESPERRKFTGDPILTARKDRGRYIADVLTIARAYHLSQTELDIFPIGSYGRWSHFVREPLVWLGETDPAETMNETARDDPATIRLHAVVNSWAAQFGKEPKTLATAVREADENLYATLKEQFPARGGDTVDTLRMGYWMRKFAGRVVDRKRFVNDETKEHGVVCWKIEFLK